MVIKNEARVEEIRITLFERLKERALMILEDEDFIRNLEESSRLQQNIKQ
jgi:hypothetical protein